MFITELKIMIWPLAKNIQNHYKQKTELYNKYSAVLRGEKHERKSRITKTSSTRRNENIKRNKTKRTTKGTEKTIWLQIQNKNKNDKTEVATVIQKQCKQSRAQKQKREEATAAAKDILNEILNVVPNLKINKNEL